MKPGKRLFLGLALGIGCFLLSGNPLGWVSFSGAVLYAEDEDEGTEAGTTESTGSGAESESVSETETADGEGAGSGTGSESGSENGSDTGTSSGSGEVEKAVPQAVEKSLEAVKLGGLGDGGSAGSGVGSGSGPEQGSGGSGEGSGKGAGAADAGVSGSGVEGPEVPTSLDQDEKSGKKAPPKIENTVGEPSSGISFFPFQKTINTIKNDYNIDVYQGKTGKWSTSEVKAINETLKTLPEDFRTPTTIIQKDGRKGTTLGWVDASDWSAVHITQASSDKGTVTETLVHEMGHTYAIKNNEVMKKYYDSFWRREGKRNYLKPVTGHPVSEYGFDSPYEDFSEACRWYVFHPKEMKFGHSERYDFLKKNVFGKEY